jgi:hypothetical protein
MSNSRAKTTLLTMSSRELTCEYTMESNFLFRRSFDDEPLPSADNSLDRSQGESRTVEWTRVNNSRSRLVRLLSIGYVATIDAHTSRRRSSRLVTSRLLVLHRMNTIDKRAFQLSRVIVIPLVTCARVVRVLFARYSTCVFMCTLVMSFEIRRWVMLRQSHRCVFESVESTIVAQIRTNVLNRDFNCKFKWDLRSWTSTSVLLIDHPSFVHTG